MGYFSDRLDDRPGRPHQRDAKDAVKLLTTATPDEAAQIAEFLTRENDRRRAEERRIFEQAGGFNSTLFNFARALVRLAAADIAGLRGLSAAAGVHGGDELDGGGVADAMVGARDDACAGFERLA